MAKDPAFLFYTSDFLTGTVFMTNEQAGIYIRLLCAQHQHGGLIEREAFLAATGEHKIIKAKFVETEDGFYNARLMEEMAKRSKKCCNLSDNAKQRWIKTKQKESKSRANVSDLNMPTENENEDEDVIEDLKILKKRYAEKVTMTEDEYAKLVRSHGAFYVEKAIFALDNYKGASGKTYSSDYRAILSWAMDKVKKEFPISANRETETEKVTKVNREGLKKFQEITKSALPKTKEQ
jgi:uncharacterized protein YdaU (DUF1376 family)